MNQHIFRETADGDLEPVFDFEGLYQTEDDPWDQSGHGDPDKAAYYASSRHRLRRAIRDRVYGGHLGLEVGCGHGHALAYLAQSMRAWHTKWSGLDISPTAIATARLLHPGLDFYVGDITGEVFSHDVSRDESGKNTLSNNALGAIEERRRRAANSRRQATDDRSTDDTATARTDPDAGQAMPDVRRAERPGADLRQEATKLLPRMPRGLQEGMEQDPRNPAITTGKGQSPEHRRRVSKTGVADTGAMRDMPKPGEREASPGLPVAPRSDMALSPVSPALTPGSFDVVVLNQVWWYVLERLPSAIENCWNLVKPGGLLIISQGFLRGEQRYARDLADGFPGAVGLMLRLCSRRFQLISATYDDRGSYPLNDGLMIFRRLA